MLVQMVLKLQPNLFARTANLVLLDGQDKVNCSRIQKSKLLSVLGVLLAAAERQPEASESCGSRPNWKHVNLFK